MTAERVAMIEKRLTEVFTPQSLNIVDESHKHAGHASAGGVDVEGLFYYSFANGLTLYSDTDIVIVNQTVGT